MQEQAEKTLQELDKIRLEGNPKWNIDKETGIFLNTLILCCDAKLVLEIGTSNGYSGIWLAEALSRTKGELITIESHVGRFQEASKNFAKAGLEKHIKQVQGHAPEVLGEIKGKFDIIFFDATKSEHILYFESLKGKLRKNGLIITDNFLSHKEKLKEFEKTIKSSPHFQTSLIPIGTGLLVSLKLTG